MNDLTSWIHPDVLANINEDDKNWLLGAFNSYQGHYPDLDQLWQLIDDDWREKGCDPEIMDERIGAFYNHPVWLLNGLFIEQHTESLEYRRQFSNWVKKQSPARIADYGGGYGSLARMIGKACPDAQVEVIEPHPHPAAISLARDSKNVRYQPNLTGKYDILIATDVFEHIPDPLALLVEAAKHLKIGGQFLIANCFYPVIKCHLPSTYHFRWSWEGVMQALGFERGESVCYGRAYIRTSILDIQSARKIEQRSQCWFKLIERSPRRLRGRLVKLLFNQAT